MKDDSFAIFFFNIAFLFLNKLWYVIFTDLGN